MTNLKKPWLKFNYLKVIVFIILPKIDFNTSLIEVNPDIQDSHLLIGTKLVNLIGITGVNQNRIKELGFNLTNFRNKRSLSFQKGRI